MGRFILCLSIVCPLIAADLPAGRRLPDSVRDSYLSALKDHAALFRAVEGRPDVRPNPGPKSLTSPPLAIVRFQGGDCSIPLITHVPKMTELASRQITPNRGMDRMPTRMPAPPCPGKTSKDR
ncbi:MAG: hypothetical protein ACKV22_35840 [Bryobacteraceae bacterium]